MKHLNKQEAQSINFIDNIEYPVFTDDGTHATGECIECGEVFIQESEEDLFCSIRCFEKFVS